MTNAARPGGALTRRPLHFFYLVDCSGSMSFDGKIQALNTAVREAIPHMRDTAANNPEAEVLVRVIKFDDGASWHVPSPTPVDQFTWTDLDAGGTTAMGKALNLVAEQLEPPNAPDRGMRPVIVLISDGQPTDDFKGGLKRLLSSAWGSKAVRIAIAIGRDADQDVLQEFISHPEYKPLSADNPEALIQLIIWTSTVPIEIASRPKDDNAVPVPQPVQVSGGTEPW